MFKKIVGLIQSRRVPKGVSEVPSMNRIVCSQGQICEIPEEVLRNCGDKFFGSGEVERAEACYRNALIINPRYSDAHINLAVALRQQKRLVEAIDHLELAILIDPKDAYARYNLGMIAQEQGHRANAIDYFGKAIELDPFFESAYRDLVAIQLQNGDTNGARETIQKGLYFNPRAIGFCLQLGDIFQQEGDCPGAISSYQQAILLQPDSPLAHGSLALALHSDGKLQLAVESYQNAVLFKSDYVAAHYNLANALNSLGRSEEAIASYSKALNYQPSFVDAYNNLGNIFRQQNRLAEAEVTYRKALSYQPSSAGALVGLGDTLRSQGKLQDALNCFRAATTLQPDSIVAYSNLLCALNYHPEFSREEIFAAYQEFDKRFGHPHRGEWSEASNDRTPDRRLKIGYVSPDFRNHAVAYFILPILKQHDHQQFEVYCYSNNAHCDEITAEIEAMSDHWIPSWRLTDEQLSQRIQGDGIDILIDLAGHTDGNRLLVFAKKPAPVQITYLGYPNTSGLSAIDYRITDHYADPSDSDAYYSERLLRLQHSLCCYQPPADMPQIQSLPASLAGFVTFGSFNNFNKIRAECIEAWAMLLRTLPSARLLMVTVPEGLVRQQLVEQFSSLGIKTDRLELHGRLSRMDFYRMFQKVDIALDPFPLTGGTTTCETLWMGVPVVILIGERFISRVGFSFLSTAGMENLAAETIDDYIKIAVNLASDIPQLSVMHAQLRAKLAASPLTDATHFTRSIEQIYREVWREWCTFDI